MYPEKPHALNKVIQHLTPSLPIQMRQQLPLLLLDHQNANHLLQQPPQVVNQNKLRQNLLRKQLAETDAKN